MWWEGKGKEGEGITAWEEGKKKWEKGKKKWEEEKGKRRDHSMGSVRDRALDLGAVPNLLIQTVGEIILEIIRAGDDVFIAAQRPWLGQGGGCHGTFLARSWQTRIQRQIRRILRLLFGQL